jgi:hypothetical protein
MPAAISEVRFWHETDVGWRAGDVSSQGQSGLLVAARWSAPLEPDRLKLVI